MVHKRRWAMWCRRGVVPVVALISTFLLPAGAIAHAAPANGQSRRAVAQGLMADFDGDGRSDYVEMDDWRCVYGDDGVFDGPWEWRVEYSSTGQHAAVDLGDCADRPVIGDFNGDGRTDYAYVRQDDPKPGLLTWHILYSSGGSTTFQWGANSLGDQPVAGDFDGDGRTDFAVIRPNDPSPGRYTWVIHYAKGGSDTHQPWGANSLGDKPINGDFDGDGKTDFAMVRPNTYSGHWTWAIDYSGGGTHHEVWGISSTDEPITGDFNGDGRTDYAVVREPTQGTSGQYLWAIDDGNGVTATQAWGGISWEPGGDWQWADDPAPGDFNGDGVSDYAVLRLTQHTDAPELWAVALAGTSQAIHHPVTPSTQTDPSDWPLPQPQDDGSR